MSTKNYRNEDGSLNIQAIIDEFNGPEPTGNPDTRSIPDGTWVMYVESAQTRPANGDWYQAYWLKGKEEPAPWRDESGMEERDGANFVEENSDNVILTSEDARRVIGQNWNIVKTISIDL